MTEDTAAGATGASGDNVALEVRLRRLEEIVAEIEGDEVALERALALFEEGVGHVRAAERVLAAAELRVEELLATGEVAPLDPAGDA